MRLRGCGAIVGLPERDGAILASMGQVREYIEEKSRRFTRRSAIVSVAVISFTFFVNVLASVYCFYSKKWAALPIVCFNGACSFLAILYLTEILRAVFRRPIAVGGPS